MSNVPGVGVTSHRLSRFTATAPATRSCPASGDWIEPILARSESKYRSLNGGLSSSDPLRIPIVHRRRGLVPGPLRDQDAPNGHRRPESGTVVVAASGLPLHSAQTATGLVSSRRRVA